MRAKKLFLSRGLILVLTIAVASSIYATAKGRKKSFQNNWNGYRGPNRNATIDGTEWKLWPENSKPEVLWQRKVGWGYSTVVIQKGRAYTMGSSNNTNRIFCLDANTGEQIWDFAYPSRTNMGGYRGPRATPSVDDKYVFTVSQEGHLHCLDVETGKKIWEKHANQFRCRQPRWGTSCSPLIYGQNVIYDLGKIIALDKATGRKRWETRDFGAGYSSPVLFQMGTRTCIAAFPKSGLVIVDAKNGRIVSQFPWKTKYDVNAAMPTIVDNSIFISSAYNTGCALVTPQKRQCKKLWQNRNMCNHFNTCVYYKGHLYGFSGNTGRRAEFVCINATTGQRTWARKGLGAGSLILADDNLIVLGENGKLVIGKADPNEFKTTRKAQPINGRCWTSPTLNEGKLICRNEAGTIICLDVSGKVEGADD